MIIEHTHDEYRVMLLRPLASLIGAVTLVDVTQTLRCFVDCSIVYVRNNTKTHTSLVNAARQRTVRTPAIDDAISAAAGREPWWN
jgi:hypothetical protein